MFAYFFICFGSMLATNRSPAQTKNLSQQAAQFENRICGVNPNRTLFRNPKYEEVVLFFVNHLPKEPIELNEFGVRFKTKAARAAELKRFKNLNFRLMRNVDEVGLTIGDRFIANKLNWLGVERSPDELDANREAELLKVLTEIEIQLKKDKVKPADQKSYLLLHVGPVTYARWKNDKLRKTSQLVALDDITVRMKSRAYVEGKDAKATALLQAVPGSGLRTSDMEKIIDMSEVAMFSGVQERPIEFAGLVAKIKKPEVKKLVDEYRVWIDQGIASLAERDELAAKTMMAQKGMGLVVLSANFGPGVADRLMAACPSQSPKSASSK